MRLKNLRRQLNVKIRNFFTGISLQNQYFVGFVDKNYNWFGPFFELRIKRAPKRVQVRKNTPRMYPNIWTCLGVHFIRNQKKGVKPFSNNPITLSSFRSPARSAGPPAVTRLMKMPSSFSLYGVEPKPPARKK